MSDKSRYAPGKNPRSMANLIHEGRPSSEEIYGEPKKKRTLSVTESGWENVQEIAKVSGCSSVSDLLERLARGHLSLVQMQSEEATAS